MLLFLFFQKTINLCLNPSSSFLSFILRFLSLILPFLSFIFGVLSLILPFLSFIFGVLSLILPFLSFNVPFFTHFHIKSERDVFLIF